jgi:hypothetical protein
MVENDLYNSILLFNEQNNLWKKIKEKLHH